MKLVGALHAQIYERQNIKLASICRECDSNAQSTSSAESGITQST